jgi:hypothetical protein
MRTYDESDMINFGNIILENVIELGNITDMKSMLDAWNIRNPKHTTKESYYKKIMKYTEVYVNEILIKARYRNADVDYFDISKLNYNNCEIVLDDIENSILKIKLNYGI